MIVVDTSCPHCWGSGDVLREDKHGKLFAWPCVMECASIGAPALVGKIRTKGLKGKGKQR